MKGFELDFIRAVIYNRGKFEQDTARCSKEPRHVWAVFYCDYVCGCGVVAI